MGKNPEKSRSRKNPRYRGMGKRPGVPNSVEKLHAIVKASEDRTQHESFLWLWNERKQLRRLVFHIPNGEWQDVQVANKRKATGVVSGVWDFGIFWSGRVIWLEFKSNSDARKITFNQYLFRRNMLKAGFTEFYVCTTPRGFKQFIDKIVLGDMVSPWSNIKLDQGECYLFDYVNKKHEQIISDNPAKYG